MRVMNYCLLFQIGKLEELHLFILWIRTKRTSETTKEEKTEDQRYFFVTSINRK